MPFIGKSPKAGNFIVLDSITTSATATYNLTRNSTAYFPASARNLIVSLNGITQAPDTAYSVSGSTITFASALTSSDVIDYILVLGDVLSIGTPADNTVGESQLSYPLTNFSSTGIDDNATSTALTFNSSQNATFTGYVTATKAILEGSYDNILELRSTDDGPVYIEFERATDRHAYLGFGGNNDVFTINNEESAGEIQFLTANTAAVTIDENQMVGIGITNPSTLLQVRSPNTTAETVASFGNISINNGLQIQTNGNLDWGFNALNSRNLTFSTNQTERMRIDSNGDTKISNQLYFGSNLGDVISLYDDRLGDANMYGFGVESSALFSRSLSYFNWYVNQTNDGSSYAMQLNGNGRLVLKGNESSSNAAEIYFMDNGSPGLVGGIEFTGTNGTSGGYNSSLQTSGELQYSAAGHFFADTSVTSSGIPTFWCRMNGDMTIGTYNADGTSVLTEYLFDVSAGHLHIDGTLYQNSSSTNSDSKMKENVVTLTNCLNKVSQLRGVEFDWKSEYVREAYHDVGLIAQEVESVIPEVVSEHEIGVGKKAGTGETLKSVDYARLTAVLIEAVKELKTQNEALEARIASLESN